MTQRSDESLESTLPNPEYKFRQSSRRHLDPNRSDGIPERSTQRETHEHVRPDYNPMSIIPDPGQCLNKILSVDPTSSYRTETSVIVYTLRKTRRTTYQNHRLGSGLPRHQFGNPFVPVKNQTSGLVSDTQTMDPFPDGRVFLR